MELTVLGKYGPYGKAKTGAASGYLVTDRDEKIVLDMGSGTLSRLMGVTDIKTVKHIFVSHLHFDHTSDLLPFRYLLEELNHTVNIYTRKEESEWYKILFDHPNFNVVNVDEDTEIKIGDMTLGFYKMKHTVPCLAVVIKGEKTLCYTGDTVYNDNIEKLFSFGDYVLADCSKPKGFHGPHMNVDNAKEFANKYSAKIITTHLSADFDPTNEFADYPDITVAEELKTYQL